MDVSHNEIFAYDLDGKGSGKEINYQNFQKNKKPTWIHADYKSKNFHQWLFKKSGIDEIICEALVEKTTHPRTFLTSNGILIVLRDENIDEQAEPEDLQSVRIWIDNEKMISTSARLQPSIQAVEASIKNNTGPATLGECLVDMIEHITDKIDSIIEETNQKVDELEKQMFRIQSHKFRLSVLDIRHQIIDLRRHLTAQRDVISRLASEQLTWFSDLDCMQLREYADRNMRFIEDLEVARDDTTVLQELIANTVSEKVESRMYVLSMVAAIFLPLSFLASLLGINVAGIPGAEGRWAFAIVSLLMVLLAVIEYWIFKKKKWF